MSNIPKLRFPEFSGKWEEKTIDSMFDEIKEKNHPTEEVLTIIQGSGTIPRKESGRNIIYDEKSLSNYKYVQENDFIIHLRSFEGGLEIANSNGIVSPAYIIMRPKLPIASRFYYSYFRSYRFINHVLPVAVEGVRDGRQIKYPILKNEKIPFPTVNEQQKIANFLSNVDSIITAETKILKTLQKKKKALMQKLFTQQLRFKSDDGKDFPAWEEKKLGECVEILDSRRKPIESKERANRKGEYPYYGASGIIDYIDDYLFEGESILLGEDGANIINRNSRLAFIATGKYWVNNHAHIMIANVDNLNYFICEYLESLDYSKICAGSAQPKLTQDVIRNLVIKRPCKEEQQKIADCLSSLDSLIQTQQKVVTTWQQRKKALLQQMFI